MISRDRTGGEEVELSTVQLASNLNSNLESSSLSYTGGAVVHYVRDYQQFSMDGDEYEVTLEKSSQKGVSLQWILRWSDEVSWRILGPGVGGGRFGKQIEISFGKGFSSLTAV